GDLHAGGCGVSTIGPHPGTENDDRHRDRQHGLTESQREQQEEETHHSSHAGSSMTRLSLPTRSVPFEASRMTSTLSHGSGTTPQRRIGLANRPYDPCASRGA